MKPTSALILGLALVIQMLTCVGAYVLRYSFAGTTTKAEEALARIAKDPNAPITFFGAQLSMECSKTLRTVIEKSITSDSATVEILNIAFPILLMVLALQVALGVCLFLVPGRTWQRVDG